MSEDCEASIDKITYATIIRVILCHNCDEEIYRCDLCHGDIFEDEQTILCSDVSGHVCTTCYDSEDKKNV